MDSETQKKLQQTKSIICDSESKIISHDKINDNFCDCSDGMDEPGTSACSHTEVKFFCKNSGFFSKRFPTSRVNDGICDCCDGLDEYSGIETCENTCKIEMDIYQKEAAAKEQQLKAGFIARELLIKESATMRAKTVSEVAELTQKITDLERQLADQKIKKEMQESIELHQQNIAIRDKKSDFINKFGLNMFSKEELIDIVIDLSKKIDVKVEVFDIFKSHKINGNHSDFPIEGEEAAYGVVSKLHDERVSKAEKALQDRKEARKKEMEAAKLAADKLNTDDKVKEPESSSEYSEHDEGKDIEYNKEISEIPEIGPRPIVKTFDLINTSIQDKLPAAEEARKLFKEVEAQLNNAKSDISKKSEDLKLDYGEKDVFYALRGKCVSTNAGPYTYSICYFKGAKQDQTSLGEWAGFDENYSVMKFTNGDKCWNGPERSLRVIMECGGSEELSNINEPGTCVYTARLKTPAACRSLVSMVDNRDEL